MKNLNKAYVVELTIQEQKEVQGGHWAVRLARFILEALAADAVANPSSAWDDFNAGRSSSNQQWGVR